jgi:hypothetical protein
MAAWLVPDGTPATDADKTRSARSVISTSLVLFSCVTGGSALSNGQRDGYRGNSSTELPLLLPVDRTLI